MGGDGMSMDELGNIYIGNQFGVITFSSKGKYILNIITDGSSTNNVFVV